MYEYILVAVLFCLGVSILGQFTYVRLHIKALEEYANGYMPIKMKISIYVITFSLFFLLAPLVFISCLTGPSTKELEDYCEKYVDMIPKNNS